ncbi:MAG: hypothetical protein KGJ13_06990 [Patescibacteria group bacterium]|nr:hypothetical protein [Patescibacteria group bacterium]
MPLNYGRQVQVIPGITGVSAGGTAQVQINPNRRVSRMSFIATGIAFVAPVLTLAGATTQPVFAVTVTAGVITKVAVTTATTAGVADGTYKAVVTDNITLADGSTFNLNNQFQANVQITVAGNAVTAVSIVSGGSVAEVPAEIFFNGQLLLSVGGVNMQDLTAAQVKAAALADSASSYNGWRTGELTFDFVKPSAEFTAQPDLTIWDLWGQSILQLQLPITSNITSPALIGVYEFDADISLRNMATVNGVSTPVLQPIAKHAQTFQIPGGGALQSITTVPFLLNPTTPLPILRLYMSESNPGNITQIEIDQDGNKILQLTKAQIQEIYSKYGFNVNIFGAMFAADYNRRISNALRCAQNLVIYIASTVTQNVTIIRETLPGAYSGG